MKWKENEPIRNIVFVCLWMLLILVVAFLIGQIIVAVTGSESKGISDILAGKTEEVDSVWDGRAVELDFDGDDIRPLPFGLDCSDTIRYNLGSYSYYPIYVSCSNPIDSVIFFPSKKEAPIIRFTDIDSLPIIRFNDIDSLKIYSDASDANNLLTIMDGVESKNKAYVVIKRTVNNAE